MKLRLAALALVVTALAGCAAPAPEPAPAPSATAAPEVVDETEPEEYVIAVQNLWQGCIQQLGATATPAYEVLDRSNLKFTGLVTVGYPAGTLSWNVGRGNSGIIIVDASDAATADALASVDC